MINHKIYYARICRRIRGKSPVNKCQKEIFLAFKIRIDRTFGKARLGGYLIYRGCMGGFKRRILTAQLGVTGLGCGSLLIGISPSGAFGLALTGMVIVGAMNTFANGPFFAILQSIVPPEIQGRVFTTLMSISMAMAPFGLAMAGPLADRFGVQLWFILGALICGLMAIWIIASPALLQLESEQMPSVTTVESAVE